MTAKPFSAILGKQLRTSAGKADSRHKIMGIIHGAAKKAGLSAEDRKAMQLEVTGKASLADMTIAEMGLVLDRLNKGRPAPMSHRPHVGKIRALWWTLYWLGAVDHPNDAALDTFVARQTGVQKIAFLSHMKAPAVIEALKEMAAREGVRWSTDADVKALVATWKEAPIDRAMLDRLAVIEAIWTKLRDLGAASRVLWEPFAQKAADFPNNAYYATPRQFDDVIKLLGKKLRRAQSKLSAD